MTKEEQEVHEIIDSWDAKSTSSLEEIWKIGDQLQTLAKRLLVENSQLRVRDSNVTFHSKNVMGINEDLQAQIKNRRCGTCKHWGESNGSVQCQLISSGKSYPLVQIEGYETEGLTTKAEFGCTLWETK